MEYGILWALKEQERLACDSMKVQTICLICENYEFRPLVLFIRDICGMIWLDDAPAISVLCAL